MSRDYVSHGASGTAAVIAQRCCMYLDGSYGGSARSSSSSAAVAAPPDAAAAVIATAFWCRPRLLPRASALALALALTPALTPAVFAARSASGVAMPRARATAICRAFSFETQSWSRSVCHEQNAACVTQHHEGCPYTSGDHDVFHCTLPYFTFLQAEGLALNDFACRHKRRTKAAVAAVLNASL